jgi:hypothetical protein
MGREVVSERDARIARDLFLKSFQGGVTGGKAAGAKDPSALPGPVAPAAAPVQVEKDRPVDRLLKYIPAEIVGTYVTLQGVIATVGEESLRHRLLWLVFVVLLPLTWLYLARVQHVTKRGQLLVSTIALAVWVFSLGGPFAALVWYRPVYGALLLPLYTIGVAIWVADPT